MLCVISYARKGIIFVTKVLTISEIAYSENKTLTKNKTIMHITLKSYKTAQAKFFSLVRFLVCGIIRIYSKLLADTTRYLEVSILVRVQIKQKFYLDKVPRNAV